MTVAMKELSLQHPVQPARRVCTLSSCSLYRYELAEFWEESLPFDVHCLTNPSTGTAERDDQTIRKVRGFAHNRARGGWAIVNPYAFRSTDARKLLTVADPIGPDNRSYVSRWMQAALSSGGRVIVGWGRALPKPLRDDALDLVSMVSRDIGCDLWCYGLTLCGQPKHPLTLSYSSELMRFVP
jgi:hypothetical protein